MKYIQTSKYLFNCVILCKMYDLTGGEIEYEIYAMNICL